MKPSSRDKKVVLISAMWLLLPFFPSMAESRETNPGTPQAEQVWVTQGLFATKLAAALKLMTTDNEVEAMRELSWFKIVPRGGWVAERPVTPGILRALRKDVAHAAEDDRFLMNTDEALRQFDQIATNLGLGFDSSAAADADSDEADNERPPVTRYSYPRDAYWDLYPWYPYAFAWAPWYVPGFFFMYDYHYYPHGHRYPHYRPHRTMQRRGHR